MISRTTTSRASVAVETYWFSAIGRPRSPKPRPAMLVPRLAKAANSVLRHGLNPMAQTTMTAPLKAIDGNADLPALMNELAARARAAARVLSLTSPEQKNRALE